ncbi:TPA: Fic family protein [Pseudomonas aeruginosa]|uniref:Fic family protein n=1 Tax=Pseudomonas aeruginosa TaxID=287 RepID=UPI000F8230AA|nr:Fic family protein [Pseudomonas aeruginosa]RTV90669.1 Fic family protein [Pseudomonas aeruginosa]
MLKNPPPTIMNPFLTLDFKNPVLLREYMALHSPLDSKGRYLHYDKLRFRFHKELDHTIAWSLIKQARKSQLKEVIKLGEPAQPGHLLLTPNIQRAISECDRKTTTAALEWMCNKIGEQQHLEYLLNDLVEDEAISSSQLEGAATTTQIAKDMLKRKRQPRTPSEKMILGNFKMMNFAWKNRNLPLSLDLIAELHTTGVEGIDDEKYRPGTFRQTDDVVVVDGEGNTVHTPPPAAGLEERLQRLVDWVNTDHCHAKDDHYIHPLVKAIIIHFSIGFEHPFHDGNGRVARSLFYWLLFKHEFGAFRYIAISTLLKSAPAKYGKSYLYTETDNLDLTYFIDYQCDIISRAIDAYMEQYKKTSRDIEEFNTFLYKSGLYGELSEKQRTIFQVAKNGRVTNFTAQNVRENLRCSYNTASTALNGLVEKGLFTKYKEGREWVFSMLPRGDIISNWKR